MAAERDVRRDPRRTLDLLWGSEPPPTRGPKPSLTLERIVQAAIGLADAEGLDAVSMRRVAVELGVTAMSLYRYVPSKGDLLDLMVDATSPASPRAVDRAHRWRDDLTLWANRTVSVYLARPWLLDVPINSAPMGPKQVAWMDWALQAMAKVGLSGEDRLNVLVLLSSYLRGHAQLRFALTQAERRTGVSTREWESAYGLMLQQAATDGKHPGMAALATSGVFDFESPDAPSDDDWASGELKFGLDRILDGIDAYLARGQARPPS